MLNPTEEGLSETNQSKSIQFQQNSPILQIKELELEDRIFLSRDDINHLKILADTNEIKIASGDLADHIRDQEKNDHQKTDSYYQDIIFALMQIRLPESEARKDWIEILKHKYMVSEKLSRNIGIHVAALDYYTNVKRRILNPTIIDVHDYVDTASRAITDELTHAYNRYFFFNEIRRLFSFAKRYNKIFSLIMVDIDYFKSYNDINGHIKGDIALIQTVNIFNAVCGNCASVCRYGGEEFCLLLPDKNIEEAYTCAENIRNAVYDFRFINEHLLPNKRLSISCGISSYKKDMANPWILIEDADIALYRAKENGRNRVETALTNQKTAE